MLKMAVITGFLSRTKDRFHEYNAPLDINQKFALLREIDGYDGVEIVYPYEVQDPVQTRELLRKYRLSIAAVNVNVKAEPEFRNGGLTSHDKAVRAKAVRFIKEAKDFAAAAGADKVTCCPLGDGYEFSFQYDYARTWRYLVDTFGEAGGYNPQIPLFIEDQVLYQLALAVAHSNSKRLGLYFHNKAADLSLNRILNLPKTNHRFRIFSLCQSRCIRKLLGKTIRFQRYSDAV